MKQIFQTLIREYDGLNPLHGLHIVADAGRDSTRPA